MVAAPVELPPIEETPLKFLHNTQQSLEKFRIQMNNRVSAIERGVDENNKPVPQIYAILLEQAQTMEATVDKAIDTELKNWPVYNEWLRHVKGIGPSLSGQLLALLIPPVPWKGPSMWIKAAGLAPQLRVNKECPLHGDNPNADLWEQPDNLEHCTCEHRLPRPRAGEGKITYHPGLRRCLYNVATSFVRNGGYYREAYEINKRRLLGQHSGQAAWPPYRIDSAARWATIKLFLCHLFEAYAATLGFTPRTPYVVEKFGHQLIPRPLPDGKSKM